MLRIAQDLGDRDLLHYRLIGADFLSGKAILNGDLLCETQGELIDLLPIIVELGPRIECEEFAEPQQSRNDVVDVVKEGPFQGCPLLLIGDVMEEQEHEPPSVEPHWTRTYSEEEILSLTALFDSNGTGFGRWLVLAKARNYRDGSSTRGTVLAGPAPAGHFVGMNTVQGLTGAQSEHFVGIADSQ